MKSIMGATPVSCLIKPAAFVPYSNEDGKPKHQVNLGMVTSFSKQASFYGIHRETWICACMDFYRNDTVFPGGNDSKCDHAV